MPSCRTAPDSREWSGQTSGAAAPQSANNAPARGLCQDAQYAADPGRFYSCIPTARPGLCSLMHRVCSRRPALSGKQDSQPRLGPQRPALQAGGAGTAAQQKHGPMHESN